MSRTRALGGRSTRSTALVVVCLVLVWTAGGPIAGAAAQVDPWAAYELRAGASGIRMRTTIPEFPLHNEMLGMAAPWAEANLDHLGTSTSRAAAAYPGAPALTVTGVAKTAADSRAPASPAPSDTSYPLLAVSSFPAQGRSERSAGSYTMTSTSDADRSAAGVRSSTGQGPSTGVEVVRADDVLSSRASSTVEEVSVGAFRAARVQSLSSVSRRPDAASEVMSELVVEAASMDGVPIVLEPGDVLTTETTTVRHMDARRTRWGVVSPALEITTVLPISPGGGMSTVTLTVAETAVSIAADPTMGAGAADPSPLAMTAMGDGAHRGATRNAVVEGARPAVSHGGRVVGPAAAAGPGALGDIRSDSPTATPAQGYPTGSASTLFPLLVFGGVALLAVMATVRRLGVRAVWR